MGCDIAISFTKLTFCIHRNIREIKTVLCYDAAGKKLGDEIVKRVNRKLAEVLDQTQADTLTAVDVDTSDAVDEWSLPWYSLSEKSDDVQVRVREFLRFIRDCPAQAPIIVGHSQFFRAFYSTRISGAFAESNPDLCANLRRRRLGNGTVLAVTVKFTAVEKSATEAEAVITNAAILFEGSESWV